MESFNEETQRAKVAAGWKGGPFFKNPMLHPKMSFVDAVPAEVKAEMQASKVPSMSMENPWGKRR